jgi:hypothetical protein
LHPGHHPHHPPHEFQPSVKIAPLPFESTSSGNISFATDQETRGDQPKVIVPNIEEELGFLAEWDTAPAATATTTSTKNNPSAGFVAAYMHFVNVEGERERFWAKAYRPKRTNSTASNKRKHDQEEGLFIDFYLKNI